MKYLITLIAVLTLSIEAHREILCHNPSKDLLITKRGSTYYINGKAYISNSSGHIPQEVIQALYQCNSD